MLIVVAAVVVLAVAGAGWYFFLGPGKSKKGASPNGPNGSPTGPGSGGLAFQRAQSSALGGPGNQQIWRATAGGPGLVGVGFDDSGGDPDAAVWVSKDGASWSRVPANPAVFGGPGRQVMSMIAAGGPGLVAVGWDGSGGDLDAAVWASEDGVQWARVAPDETVFGGPGDQSMNRIVAGGPGFVAVGGDTSGGDLDAAVWVSQNGVQWARVAPDETVFGGDGGQSIRGVVKTARGIVAGGFSGGDATVWISNDGVSWARLKPQAALAGPGDQEIATIIEAPPGLVAVGVDSSSGSKDAAVWTSADGTTWNKVKSGEFGGQGDQEMQFVVLAGSTLAAVGADDANGDPDAAVWTSPDGATWTRVASDTFGGSGEQLMKGVAAQGSTVIALGWDQSGGDFNGAVWTAKAP